MSLPQRPMLVLTAVIVFGTIVWPRPIIDFASSSSSSAVALPVLAFAAVYSALCIVYGIWAIFLYPFYFSPLRHLPQPTTGNHVLLGQFLRIFREASGKPALEWINTIPNNGLIRYLGLFNQERLLVTQPKALAEVLVSKNYDFAKPKMMREALARFLGVGVLLAEGDEHRFQRKNLAPAFAFRHVKDLYPVFWRKGRESVVAMRRALETDGSRGPRPGTGALEIHGWASRVTLDIIGLAGLGRDFGAIQNPDNELAKTYNAMLSPSRSEQVLTVLGMVLPRWVVTRLPFRRNADVVHASQFLRQTCADLVQQKKANLARRLEAGLKTEKTEKSQNTDVDILSVALESGGFTDANLADQMMTFLAAGHETTSSAMTWAVYLLCTHPDVQDRLRAEIRAHLPSLGDQQAMDGASAGPDIASTDIDHLPYLHAVCSEVLRYFSPVPATLREAAVDTSIQGQFVPRGTRIMLVPWAVNKSRELWGDSALTFDPERWLGGKDGKDNKDGKDSKDSKGGSASNYAFMTFLHGPRSCIGMGFARAEFACLLAAWVGRFEFRLQNPADYDEDSLEIHGGVSARPKKGMHVFVTPLEGW